MSLASIVRVNTIDSQRVIFADNLDFATLSRDPAGIAVEPLAYHLVIHPGRVGELEAHAGIVGGMGRPTDLVIQILLILLAQARLGGLVISAPGSHLCPMDRAALPGLLMAGKSPRAGSIRKPSSGKAGEIGPAHVIQSSSRVPILGIQNPIHIMGCCRSRLILKTDAYGIDSGRPARMKHSRSLWFLY